MFKLVDTNKRWMPTYDLKGQRVEQRLLFLAEVHHSIPNKGYRIYLAFCDTSTMQFYIEELVGSELKMIESDALASDLNLFLDMYGIKTFDALKPWVEQPMVAHPTEKKIIISG